EPGMWCERMATVVSKLNRAMLIRLSGGAAPQGPSLLSGWLPRGTIALACLAFSTLQAASLKLVLDSSRSYIVAVTRKSGALSFAAGHDHAILATAWSADVCFDHDNPAASRVSIVIPTGSLRIDTPEARRQAGIKPEGPSPKDIQEIQRKMLGPENL